MKITPSQIVKKRGISAITDPVSGSVAFRMFYGFYTTVYVTYKTLGNIWARIMI